MSAAAKTLTPSVSSKRVAEPVKTLDWERVSQGLDAQGRAMIERLLSPDDCQAIVGLYQQDDIFRSHVLMGRHGFGRGEYKYFSYPLPDLIAGLRTAIYPYLVPIANRWNNAIGIDNARGGFFQGSGRKRLMCPDGIDKACDQRRSLPRCTCTETRSP